MSKATLESIPVSISQMIDLKIDSMAYDNSAIGRYKDFVVMVDRGAPGDLVKAQITTLRPNHAHAKIIEITKSDPNYRVEAPCKLFKVCGGCQWQHLPYEKQLEQKNLLLKNFFLKLNLKEGVLKSIIGAYTQHSALSTQHLGVWHYRNKVQYPVRTVESTGRLKAGYFEWHSNELVNVKHCPIQHSLFDEIIETVRELAPKYKIIAYDSKTKKGWLRHICVRIGQGKNNTNEALLTLVAINDSLSNFQEFTKEIIKKHPELVGICININKKSTNVIYGDKTVVIKGRGYIFEKIKGKDLKFKISATSFFQVNTQQTEKLLDIINEMICRGAPMARPPIGCILDTYCGVGLISLFLSKYAKKIIGIEEIKQSIEDAKSSAKENNIKNTFFINGKVENKIKDILEKERPELVILDPPRIGCDKRVLNEIDKSKNIKKIIYVSCNPSTLLRDLEILCRGEPVARPFKIKSIQPIDMFPHTYHVECIVLLERCIDGLIIAPPSCKIKAIEK